MAVLLSKCRPYYTHRKGRGETVSGPAVRCGGLELGRMTSPASDGWLENVRKDLDSLDRGSNPESSPGDSTPPRPPPSFQHSRYELRERLGEGATAVVYAAWDRELHRSVAIKFLREVVGMSDVAR